MKAKYVYVNKRDNSKKYSFKELSENFGEYFQTYLKFSEWIDENFNEEIIYEQTPYEKTKNDVYASGNVWTIQNFNETHN